MAFGDVRAEAIEAPRQDYFGPKQMYRLGVRAASGRGGKVDLVEAHKWFNLAAINGFRDAKTARQEMAAQMTSLQIAAAQRAAREWMRVQAQSALPAPALAAAR